MTARWFAECSCNHFFSDERRAAVNHVSGVGVPVAGGSDFALPARDPERVRLPGRHLTCWPWNQIALLAVRSRTAADRETRYRL